nr:unnamed protein product [Callosobruchus analis]
MQNMIYPSYNSIQLIYMSRTCKRSLKGLTALVDPLVFAIDSLDTRLCQIIARLML